VPRVLLRVLLTHENMAQVCSAVGALYLGAHAVGVWEPFYCAGDFVVEARPAAVCFKLVFRAVEFGAATFADVGAFLPESVVFAGEGHFCAFIYDYLFLFRG